MGRTVGGRGRELAQARTNAADERTTARAAPMLPIEAVLSAPLLPPSVAASVLLSEAEGVETAVAVAPRSARNWGIVPGTGSYSPDGAESSVVPSQHQVSKQVRQIWLRSWPPRATARSASAQERQVDQSETVLLSVMERAPVETE